MSMQKGKCLYSLAVVVGKKMDFFPAFIFLENPVFEHIHTYYRQSNLDVHEQL